MDAWRYCWMPYTCIGLLAIRPDPDPRPNPNPNPDPNPNANPNPNPNRLLAISFAGNTVSPLWFVWGLLVLFSDTSYFRVGEVFV